VIVPPQEYDPVTSQELTEFREVADEGVVTTWGWISEPLTAQPLQHPFAWALVQLDGADVPFLHAVDAGDESKMSTGMRVKVRWAAEPVDDFAAIECFGPHDRPAPDAHRLHGLHGHRAVAVPQGDRRGPPSSASACPSCSKVYVPPRGSCPTCGVPTKEQVELAGTGIVTTFCVVNIPFAGQAVECPYVSASILLDGADIPLFSLIQEIPFDQVRMGLRVEAVWADELRPTLESIKYFKPTGEPDAEFESFGAPLMRDVAVVSYAQSPPAFHDDARNEVEILMPVLDEAFANSGIGRKDVGFTVSGSSDYLAGQAFSFVTALDAVGPWPPISESHVEMDGAWALYEAWVKLQMGRHRHRPRLCVRQVVAW